MKISKYLGVSIIKHEQRKDKVCCFCTETDCSLQVFYPFDASLKKAAALYTLEQIKIMRENNDDNHS